nr:ATP-binding cassette domain-containing protein [Tetragenococcus halophilus]
MILDEPSAGLHPQDIERVSQALIAIKNKGNTVVLVEHHPQLIQMADYIIDIGPKAGENGGAVQFAGPYSEFLQSNTITSRALHEKVPLNDSPRTSENTLSIKNADLHNLKNLSVDIPLGVLAVICGVAGSGKSSLASVIYQKIMQQDKEMVYISQKNIGVNLRSTPMTYLNIFDKIRSLFAKENNVSPAWFSYNSKGACPRCKGKGIIVSDMSFMEDVTTVCELCHGARYNEEATQYFYQGKTIVDVLDMNVNESFAFFKDQPFAQELKQLLDVGLGYLKLNQSLTTLSGGELQRLKLADNLHREGTIYLLDEPTDGLHLDDIQQLLDLFEQMVDEGNSIILLEHHISVIKRADWVIEIGPEGGDKGGYLTFSGTVQDLAKTDNTVTAPYLVN